MADTEHVQKLAAIIREVDGTHSKGAAALAESILDHPRFRAVLANEPAVPEGREWPSDEELNRLLWYEFTTSTGHGERTNPIAFARAVLARWGKVAPVPVAVSERLPEPENCAPWPQPSDKSGWCWMSRTVHGFYGSFAIWEQVSVVPMCREVYTHWLPAHALPLPEVGE